MFNDKGREMVFAGDTKVCVHGLPGDYGTHYLVVRSPGELIEVELHNCDFTWRGEREVRTVTFRACYFQTDEAGIRHYRVLGPKGF